MVVQGPVGGLATGSTGSAGALNFTSLSLPFYCPFAVISTAVQRGFAGATGPVRRAEAPPAARARWGGAGGDSGGGGGGCRAGTPPTRPGLGQSVALLRPRHLLMVIRSVHCDPSGAPHLR